MPEPTSSKPHICFVAPSAWPVLSGDNNIKFAGGAEVQQCILARGLVDRGYKVSMICTDHGQPDQFVVDGVTVFKAFGYERGGVPILRFFHPRLTSLWAALKRADADIYYQRCAAATTGVVALFARYFGRSFIYSVAHDLDLIRDETWKIFQRRAGWRDRQLFMLGLKLADAVVVQHAGQAMECRRWYGRKATIIPNCYVSSCEMKADAGGFVLWVSMLRKWKRPELFVELARRLPHLRFRMVGGPCTEEDGSSFFERIKLEAQHVPNLEFFGFVPLDEVESHFDAARLFVNTSEDEGFPNTFLQSWARGIPTVSFFDTGSLMDGQSVVTVTNDLNEMASSVDTLMRDDASWRVTGQRARAYCETFHTRDVAIGAYEQIFERLHAGE